MDDSKIVLEGEAQRPNDGHVSDTGNFVIADWLFGEGLKSKFYAFSVDGTLLVEQLFQANLYNTGISASGKFAVCQMANADSKDGGKLFLFDLSSGAIRSQVDPESGWAHGYQFDEANETLSLLYDKDRSYKYAFSGEFLDCDRWSVERLDFASAYELIDIAAEKLKSPSALSREDYAKIDQLLTKALTDQISDNYCARGHRYRGEIQLALGNKDQAIIHLERALALNSS